MNYLNYTRFRLFLSDVTTDHSLIQRSQLFSNNNISNTNSETIHRVALSSIHGIAVDWVVGNLYWTDKGEGEIGNWLLLDLFVCML